MILPGRLRLTTLGDVLGSLHRAHASGVLELTEDHGLRHRVHFDGGLVHDVDTELAGLRLGELLARQGLLGSRGLARLAERLMQTPSLRAGQILVDEGLATADLVAAGLRRQVTLKLDALFKLEDARISFHLPRPRPVWMPPLSPREFLHGRMRRRRAQARYQSPPGTEARVRERAYHTLGLAPGADRASIQRAFRSLAKDAHPDRFPNADSAERQLLLTRFAELSAAYHTLSR